MNEIAGYLCIGDSMSIDLYPHRDIAALTPNARQNIGAAALLHSNDSGLWPEFRGRDLSSIYPDIKYFNLAEDGATTFSFLDDEYLSLMGPYWGKALIITLTLGGNDLLDLVGRSGKGSSSAELGARLNEIKHRFSTVVEIISSRFPRSIMILNSVYDPTDGTGKLSEYLDFSDKLEYLYAFNDHVRRTADERKHLFADIHDHFRGHGLSARSDELWYWAPSPIEPGARGASEIRRLWVDLLTAYGLLPHSG